MCTYIYVYGSSNQAIKQSLLSPRKSYICCHPLRIKMATAEKKRPAEGGDDGDQSKKHESQKGGDEGINWGAKFTKLEEMMKTMLQKQEATNQKVESSMTIALEAKTAAVSAAAEAAQANEGAAKAEAGLAVLQHEVAALKESGIEEIAKKVLADAYPPLPTSTGGANMSKGVGRGLWGQGVRTGRGPRDPEKRMRTITFANFPEDTKAQVIKDTIDEILQEVKADVEEIYSFGKRATRGAARFKTSESMWKYMTKHAGNHVHEYFGNNIYTNVDSPTGGDQRERAVRKVVRVIIEQNGNNGKEIKKDIDTDYVKGIVWWKDERVAEWDEGQCKMELKGDVKEYAEQFKTLMEQKQEK